MRPKMEEHAPRARCYQCGSPEICALCHHCGKAMCAEHRPIVLSPAGQPVSKEFSGLGIKEAQATAYHCAAHAHIVKGDLWRLIWIGVGVIAVGIGMALASLVAGLVLLLCGAAMAVGGFLVTQKRAEAARTARPPLPLIPDLVSVRVAETLHGGIRLDDKGDYTSEPGPVQGQIDVAMEFANPGLELQSYRSKYRLSSDDGIEFSAGYAVISDTGDASSGTDDLAVMLHSGPAAIPLPTGTGIAFRGPVAGHPLFSHDNGRSPKWTACTRYGLLPSREPETVPLWLVPSLMPDSNHRTLELDLQWVTVSGERGVSGRGRRALDLDRFELIELNVPAAWGNVVSCSEGAMISGPFTLPGSGESVRTIKWKRPKKEHGHRSQSLTLAIRFENKIELHRKDGDRTGEYHKLTGKIRASFTGAFSGIKDVAIYRALGDPWQKKAPEPGITTGAQVDIKTEVSVDFDLSLRFIRYQDVWVIPDSAADAKRASSTEYSVIPDYETVIGLTNELSGSRYYVKRVIENPPRGGRRANLANRYWDIAGYYYDRVFPIDFHITVTGEEEYQGGIRAHAGSTATQITVQGSYVELDTGMRSGGTGGPDGRPEGEGNGNLDMKSQIERRWKGLSALVDKKLKALPQVARPYTPPQESGQAYQMTAEPSAGPAQDGKAARAARLREQRDAIKEALLAGRICEQTYLELKAEIDGELGSI